MKLCKLYVKGSIPFVSTKSPSNNGLIRQAFNLEIVGSIPRGGTRVLCKHHLKLLIQARVMERHTCLIQNQDSEGSNPSLGIICGCSRTAEATGLGPVIWRFKSSHPYKLE